ncbi:NAD(P)-dependent oxidoreductase [Trebonia sp.]|uniref:NAD-dependent epimerase/dehydratase family protein n=1 Tax=Trebonia sp. TaxID=2767075 RepID=UPI002623504A|nr:NAD(P)-dependent oxidoreductase [Trebonia sp.]
MRILIIGASSFLGGHVRREAASAGHTVLTAGRSALPGQHLRLDLVADPVAQVASLVASAAPEVVVNCAGATSGSADALAAANITAVHTLVTALLQSRARVPARLVHVGSAAEYGAAEDGVPVAETAVPRPAGLYGVTKLGGTRLVELARTAGLDAVVLRVFNVVGAGAPEDSLPGHAAAQLRRLLAAANGTSLRLGPLHSVRDFVDARDVADAALAAAAAPSLPHAVVNVGSGTGVPARVLVQELLAASGCDVQVREDAPGSARTAGLDWQQADITRAAEDLGWRPRRDLAAAVRDLWNGA